MKILHVIHSANPAGGGPIEAIKQLAAIHEGEGHHIEVASMDPPEANWAENTSYASHSLGTTLSSYGFTPKFVPWLQSRRKEFDLVVSHGLWQYNGTGVHQALKGSDTPYCVFPHGMLDPWFKRRYPLKHLKKWIYWSLLEYRVLRDAAGVLFTCEEERLQAARTFWPYHCRERVVSFGTAAPTGSPDGQRTAFLTRFPELQGKRLLLFLGRIHEKKGCRELLDAFREVCGDDRAAGAAPLHLVIAGPADNAYGRELQQMTVEGGWARRVTWTGMLAGDVKWGAFHASEAFILPSHQENFGIAVAEALACGLPVLISNKVNIWREIERDGAGQVEPDDLAGTVRLLERWRALGASDRAEMGRAARRSFEERFEIRKAAHDLLGLFEKLIAQQRKRRVFAGSGGPVCRAATADQRAGHVHDSAQ